jgi:Spy/CpxP family protein refolding chaperone
LQQTLFSPTQETDMEIENQTTESTSSRTGWARRIVIAGAAAIAVAGVGMAAATGGDFARGGVGGHITHARMGGEFAAYRLDKLLEEIDATADQKGKAKAVFDDARGDLIPMFEGFVGTRQAIADILGAPTIDRDAAEKLRRERISALDDASRRLTQAVLDTAEILTPEQRAELVAHFKERGARRRW